jgi:hypothetical protein
MNLKKVLFIIIANNIDDILNNLGLDDKEKNDYWIAVIDDRLDITSIKKQNPIISECQSARVVLVKDIRFNDLITNYLNDLIAGNNHYFVVYHGGRKNPWGEQEMALLKMNESKYCGRLLSHHSGISDSVYNTELKAISELKKKLDAGICRDDIQKEYRHILDQLLRRFIIANIENLSCEISSVPDKNEQEKTEKKYFSENKALGCFQSRWDKFKNDLNFGPDDSKGISRAHYYNLVKDFIHDLYDLEVKLTTNFQ